ncbi:MAG: DUF3379 family protein [Woeseiaceae bacterium]
MNCEEYRLEIAADPSFDGGAAHLSECGECQAFRLEMLSLNDKISGAMRLDVPEMVLPELPEIGDSKVVSLNARRPRPMTAWFAVAATVVLAAVLGVRMLGVGATYDTLADEVLAHLDHEPASLRPSTTPVSDTRLAKVVPANVARLDHSAGLITYARSCTINGKTVPHLVVQGERGPITILLMPEETVSEAVSLDGDNTHGVILPVGEGSVAIIGGREEKLERVEKSVMDSVKWSI